MDRINICRRTSSCTQPPKLNARRTLTYGRWRSESVCLQESMSSSPRPLKPIKRESSFSGSSLRRGAHPSKYHWGSLAIFGAAADVILGIVDNETAKYSKAINEGYYQWIAGILMCPFFFTERLRTWSALTKCRFATWLKNIKLYFDNSDWYCSGEMTQNRRLGFHFMSTELFWAWFESVSVASWCWDCPPHISTSGLGVKLLS